MQFLAVVTLECAGDVPVLAIDAAHTVLLRTRCTPYVSGGSLLRRIFVMLRIDDRLSGLVDNLTRIDLGLRHVGDQIRHDASGMHGEGADALTLTDRVQRDGEQGISVFD